jgi:glycosyltransferase involved in cell wall biosynthesis
VQHNWLVKKYHSPLRFLAPLIWGSFDLSGYDVVLSSSGWFICRGVKVPDSATHICYIHHPPRNLYGYATGSTLQKYPLVRAYAAVINFFMRQYDYRTAQKVDYFVANSQETARRVTKFYRRTSTVIYPPVAAPTPSSGKSRKATKDYYLSVGRLMWAKRVDIAIRAANTLRIPLKIVGSGPEETALRAIAGPTVEFVGAVSDAALADLYRNAKATIFCALDEDFGIVPVESMSMGTPVIALAQGGVKETVKEGITGKFFGTPDETSLTAVLSSFEKEYDETSYRHACIEQAAKYSTATFTKALSSFIEEKYRQKQQENSRRMR